MAQLITKRLRMESWTAELAETAMHNAARLEQMLGVAIPDGFPSQPVRDFVLPTEAAELRTDPNHGVWRVSSFTSLTTW